MCYPKPGPRCSAHARNKYIQAKAAARRDRSFDTTVSVREAEAEFYTTPAGFRELKRLIDRDEDAVRNRELLIHYKQVRAEQLAAINAKDDGDLEHEYLPPKNTKPVELIDLPAPGSKRKAWKTLSPEEYAQREMEYIDDSSEWVDKLSPNEIAATRWMTSNGFHEMGQLDRGEPFQPYHGETETDEQKIARITRMRKTLDKALAKAPDKARIVYRGISVHSTPPELMERLPRSSSSYSSEKQYATEEEWDAAQTKYLDNLVTQGTLKFERPVSATEDPAVGVRFAGGQNAPDFMYEISTKRGAPVAVASAWGASESEIVLPSQTQYKVVGYEKNAIVRSYTDFRNKGEFDEHITIIQLQEI